MPRETINEADLTKRIVLHPSIFSHFGLLIAFVLSLIIYIYTSVNYDWSVQEVLIFGRMIPLPMFAIFPVMLLVGLFAKHFNFKYIIDENQIRTLSGIISLRMQDKTLDMQHIRGVEIDRNIFDRIFNTGDIEIGSAMHGKDDLVMFGVYNPDLYRRIIESRMNAETDYSDKE